MVVMTEEETDVVMEIEMLDVTTEDMIALMTETTTEHTETHTEDTEEQHGIEDTLTTDTFHTETTELTREDTTDHGTTRDQSVELTFIKTDG